MWHVLYLVFYLLINVDFCWALFISALIYISVSHNPAVSQSPAVNSYMSCSDCLSEQLWHGKQYFNYFSLIFRIQQMQTISVSSLCVLQRDSAASFSSVVNELQCSLPAFRFLFSLWRHCTAFLIFCSQFWKQELTQSDLWMI